MFLGYVHFDVHIYKHIMLFSYPHTYVYIYIIKMPLIIASDSLVFGTGTAQEDTTTQ